MSPSGAVAELHTFEWTFDERLEPNGRFQLSVFARDGSGAKGPKLFEQRTREMKLEIPAEVSASWPESIVWRVEVLGSTGMPGDFCEESAQRLPR